MPEIGNLSTPLLFLGLLDAERGLLSDKGNHCRVQGILDVNDVKAELEGRKHFDKHRHEVHQKILRDITFSNLTSENVTTRISHDMVQFPSQGCL